MDVGMSMVVPVRMALGMVVLMGGGRDGNHVADVIL